MCSRIEDFDLGTDYVLLMEWVDMLMCSWIDMRRVSFGSRTGWVENESFFFSLANSNWGMIDP